MEATTLTHEILRHLAYTAIIGEHYPPGLSAVDALEGNV